MKIKKPENKKMSLDIIEKTALTQVPANVGHNGWFTSTFLDNLCVIFVLNIQPITKLTK